jgi:hypothetical protein
MCFRTLSRLAVVLATAGAAAAHDEIGLQDGASAFAEGKKLIDEGKDARAAFQQAMTAFAKNAAQPSRRAASAQNLGNAAFLADELPSAILSFRAGLSHDPHHPVLRANLVYARAQVRYPPNRQSGRPEPELWPAWLPRWRSMIFVVVGGFVYCLAFAALTVLFFQRRFWLAAAAGLCFGLAGAAAYACYLTAWQWRYDLDRPPVVIRYDGVALRTGNGVSYPQNAELPTLSRGMEARKLAARGDWLQVRFASGEIGWVRTQDVCWDGSHAG